MAEELAACSILRQFAVLWEHVVYDRHVHHALDHVVSHVHHVHHARHARHANHSRFADHEEEFDAQQRPSYEDAPRQQQRLQQESLPKSLEHVQNLCDWTLDV
jgi:hypothetical protein